MLIIESFLLCSGHRYRKRGHKQRQTDFARGANMVMFKCLLCRFDEMPGFLEKYINHFSGNKVDQGMQCEYPPIVLHLFSEKNFFRYFVFSNLPCIKIDIVKDFINDGDHGYSNYV